MAGKEGNIPLLPRLPSDKEIEERIQTGSLTPYVFGTSFPENIPPAVFFETSRRFLEDNLSPLQGDLATNATDTLQYLIASTIGKNILDSPGLDASYILLMASLELGFRSQQSPPIPEQNLLPWLREAATRLVHFVHQGISFRPEEGQLGNLLAQNILLPTIRLVLAANKFQPVDVDGLAPYCEFFKELAEKNPTMGAWLRGEDD